MVALLQLLVVPTGLAQEASFDSEQQSELREEMVVTGTRTPRLLADSPVTVDIVKGETLRQVTQTTLAQALDFMPGVVVKRSVKDGYNVYMQGFDGDRVLVLVDGQPLVSPSGAAVDLDQISVADIERIEIVRGAGSVLYGSSAMGGVINVITRRQDKNSLGANVEFSSRPDYAVDDALGGQLRVWGSFRRDGWCGGAQAQWIEDPGFDYEPQTASQTAADLEKQFLKINLGRELAALDVSYRFQQFNEQKERAVGQVPGQSALSYYRSDVDQQQHDLSIRPSKKSDWKVNFRSLAHSETSGRTGGLRDAEIGLHELDGQKIWQGKHTEWVAGAVVRGDRLDQVKHAVSESLSPTVEVDDKSREALESYLQGSWINDNFELLGGARVQNDSDFGWHSALRVSGRKEFNFGAKKQLQWRLGAGQSYRVPTLKERYYVFDHSNLGYMVLGNPDLEPEEALSANTTFTWLAHLNNFTRAVELELNVHYSDAENFIDSFFDPSATEELDQGVEIYRYQNIGTAIFHGVDASVQYSQKSWQAQLSYSYLDVRDESEIRLPDRPLHQLKGNISWQLNARAQLLFYFVHERDEYVSDEYLGVEKNQWTSLNLSFRHAVSERFSWRLGVDNLANEHKAPGADRAGLFDIRPISSRKFFASLEYTFF